MGFAVRLWRPAMKSLPQDRPYRFRPPVSRQWLNPLFRFLNREWFLKRAYRVGKIECEGIEEIRSRVEAGDAVVLAPNHADHADVHVMYEVTRQVGIEPRFMGAREIFEAGALSSFALQSAGVFSVDRDGPDIASIKTAIGLLEEGKHPLVMYPEGEIYHHHEWPDPLHDGVASILLRVARKLPPGKSAWLAPVAFRFEWHPEVEAGFNARLSALERSILWKPAEDLPVVERLLRLGAGVTAAKEVEFFGDSGNGTLTERLERLRERLLADVEGRRGKDAKAATVPERVRALRFRIRRALLDEANPPQPDDRRALLGDLERAHVAYQAYSYPGVYLTQDPDRHRIAETLTKVEEDLLGKATYPSDRTARIVFGEPLDVGAMLKSGELPEKGGALELTAMLEKRLRAMLGGPVCGG